MDLWKDMGSQTSHSLLVARYRDKTNDNQCITGLVATNKTKQNTTISLFRYNESNKNTYNTVRSAHLPSTTSLKTERERLFRHTKTGYRIPSSIKNSGHKSVENHLEVMNT